MRHWQVLALIQQRLQEEQEPDPTRCKEFDMRILYSVSVSKIVFAFPFSKLLVMSQLKLTHATAHVLARIPAATHAPGAYAGDDAEAH